MSESRIAIVIDANGQAAIAEFDAVSGAMKRTMGNADLLNVKGKSLGDGPDAAGKKWQDFGKLAGTAIASLIGGLTAMVAVEINAADEAGRLAKKLGVSSEFITEMGYAAKLSDSDIKTLGSGLLNLSKITTAAAGGVKKQQAWFDAIGLSALDAKGKVKSLEQLLPQIADKFAGLKDGPQKAALAMKLFGSAGKELIPLLNEGASGIQKLREEAVRLGLSMSDDATAGAAQLKDQMDQLTAITQGYFTKIAVDLLPVLLVLAKIFVDQADAASGASQETGILTKAVQLLSSAAVIAAGLWEALVNIIAATVDTIAIAVKNAVNQISSVISTVKSQVKLIKEGEFSKAFALNADLFAKVKQQAEDARAKITASFESAGTGIDDAMLKASDRVADIMNPPGLEGSGTAGKGLDELNLKLGHTKKASDDAAKAAEHLADAQAKWADRVKGIEAQLGGSLAEAEYEHAKAIAEAAEAYKKKEIALADYMKLAEKGGLLDQQLAEKKKKLAADALRDERSALAPSEKALKNVREELRLRGLSGNEREREIDLFNDEETIQQLLLQLEEDRASISKEKYEQAKKNIELLDVELAKRRSLLEAERVRSGGLLGLISDASEGSLKEGGKNFFSGFWDGLKKVFKPTGENGKYTSGDYDGIKNFVGSAIGVLSDLRDVYRGSDGNGTGEVLRSVVKALQAVPGPVGWIAMIVNFVDQLAGGKLFGTSFKRESAARNLSFGEGGFSGSTSVTDVRQRSFFRGRTWRTTTTGLDAQQKSEFDTFFEQVGLATRGAVRLLSTTLPDIISGTFREQFDKDGKLVSSISTVLGKTYSESAQEFTQRIQAENMIAVLATVLPAAELNAVADAWRSDASRLSEGASLLLQYSAEVQQGLALLTGPGALGRMVTIVEELQGAGETLAQTYQRLTQTARAYGAVVAQAEGELLLKNASSFAKSIIQIRQEEIQRTRALRDQARALGNISAREEDLARVREAARIKIVALTRQHELELLDTVASLYGTPLAQIEAEIARITGTADDAAGKVRNFMQSLLLSQELSPLPDREKLDVSRSSLLSSVAAKDSEGFIKAAQSFLEISRRLNASGADYTADFELVNSLSSQFGSTTGSNGNLADLIAQRDAILARQRQAERLGQAQELAQGIADLSDVRGVSFTDVASSLGVDLGALATDLGLNATSMNAYLESLQVDTADLALILLDLPDRFARALFDVLAATNLQLTPTTPVIIPNVPGAGTTPGQGGGPIGGGSNGGNGGNGGNGDNGGSSMIQAVNMALKQLSAIVNNTAVTANATQDLTNAAMYGPVMGAQTAAL